MRVHCAEPKFLGEIKFACVLGATKKRRKKKGQHHDHDGRVHANAHAVAGEERADGGRAGL